MQPFSWRTIGISTAIFCTVIVFLLLGIHALLATSLRSWTTVLTDSLSGEGAGGTIYTLLDVTGVGSVAVRVRLPRVPRTEAGSPIIVYIPRIFSEQQKVFQEFSGLSDLGVAQVSFLLPGTRDRETNMLSTGAYDYAGDASQAALREVFLYAAGARVDSEGKFLADRTTVPLDQHTLGAYAYAHASILLFATLAEYGDVIPLDFVVAHENSVAPLFATQEVGFFERGSAQLNTLYDPNFHYRDTDIALPYATIAWDALYEQPFFDVNGDGLARKEDDVLLPRAPWQVDGKQMYSPELLDALRKKDIFSSWPTFLATPEESRAFWQARHVTPSVIAEVARVMPRLPVLILFGELDHAQPAPDKPHVHQLFSALRAASLWVRLNPDKSYVALFDTQLADVYTDHLANQAPDAWFTEIAGWGYPGGASVVRSMTLAALAEMTDRVTSQQWDADILSL